MRLASRAGRPAGRRPRGPARRLPRSDHPPTDPGPTVPRSLPPHGPLGRQREEPVGPRPGPAPTPNGGPTMTSNDADARDGGASDPGLASGSSSSVAGEGSLAATLEEFLDLVKSGRRPARDEFLDRHGSRSGELADCLDGLEFILSAAP